VDFQQKLENLAQLAVRVGNNVQAGQRLTIRAPLEAAPLVRLVARQAYQIGASFVDIHWMDEQSTLERLLHSEDQFMSELSEWPFMAREFAVERGDAYLSILASDPGVYERASAERVSTMMRAVGVRAKKSLEAFGAGQVNWAIVAYAVPSWARRIFPELSEEAAMQKLWDAIFMCSRADQADPVAAWMQHLNDLEAKREFLNTQGLKTLEFKAPGTDLRIELPEQHVWHGGSSHTEHAKHKAGGIRYVPNIPTEEVFTMPHRLGVNGTARASKPLSHQGRIIEGIELTYQDGKVVHAKARTHEDSLHKLLETDEGAARLGEVAIVAESSPVARSGVLFQETLFDENAACHIAQGRAYADTLRGGTTMSREALLEAGGNDSQVHVDWMIGSKDMDVTGIRQDGSSLAILRSGEWAFKPE
jgi:aminopeptidase